MSRSLTLTTYGHAELERFELGGRVADAIWEENELGTTHAFDVIVGRCEAAGYVRGASYAAADDGHPLPLTPPREPRPPHRPGGGR